MLRTVSRTDGSRSVARFRIVSISRSSSEVRVETSSFALTLGPAAPRPVGRAAWWAARLCDLARRGLGALGEAELSGLLAVQDSSIVHGELRKIFLPDDHAELGAT
jgi:hypothetical protein